MIFECFIQAHNTMGTHSDGHLTPAKEELLGMR